LDGGNDGVVHEIIDYLKWHNLRLAMFPPMGACQNLKDLINQIGVLEY
jgi:hypothetical protein